LPLTGKTTINQNWHIISARTTNQSVDTVTCREIPVTIATIDSQATTSIPTISRSRPPIAGTGFAGNTITVVRENTTLCTAVVAANGAWTCTPSSDMAPGVIAIKAKSSRNGVNHRRQAEATFVIGCATGEAMTTTTTTETIPEIKTWRQHDGVTTCTDICSRRGETYTGLCSSGERTVTEVPQAWYIYGRRGDPIPGNNLVQLVSPSSA
jgi:Bacterial Ig-like domain